MIVVEFVIGGNGGPEEKPGGCEWRGQWGNNPLQDPAPYNLKFPVVFITLLSANCSLAMKNPRENMQ